MQNAHDAKEIGPKYRPFFSYTNCASHDNKSSSNFSRIEPVGDGSSFETSLGVKFEPCCVNSKCFSSFVLIFRVIMVMAVRLRRIMLESPRLGHIMACGHRAVATSRGGNFGVGQREKLWREFFFRSFAVV
jgi:hypothetical protein